MPRPHTEFIQAQLLPWQPWSRPGGEATLERRLLSEDTDSGSSSALLRYPRGFTDPDQGPWSRAEELFVLDGSVTIAGTRFNAHDYGFVPPAAGRREVASDSGAVILTFISPESLEPTPDQVVKVASGAMAWAPGISDPNLSFMGLGRKVLRDDPRRQERTLLITMAPQAYPAGLRAPQISHPCVEECYLIAGDVITEYGVMGPGAYFWRPPEVPHGPHGSRYGAFMVIRFVEGQHQNEWGSEPKDFVPYPPYRPVLPDHLMPYAKPRPLEPY